MVENNRKRKRAGRPPLPMLDEIPDTPENVARALMWRKPRQDHEWRYLREHADATAPTRAERRRARRTVVQTGRSATFIDFVSPTCPGGHPDTLARWTLDSIEPEQCPDCGVTPIIKTSD